MFVHANLKPIKTFVREDVLYDMNVAKYNNYVSCKIIGVSCYANHVPTFQIILDDTNLFYYIPPHLFSNQITASSENQLSLKQLVYHNCPSSNFALFESQYLQDRSIYAFIKDLDVFLEVKYLFTLDWHEENDLLHCCMLNNGQLGFFPNHKISLKAKELPKYKKLHAEWKV